MGVFGPPSFLHFVWANVTMQIAPEANMFIVFARNRYTKRNTYWQKTDLGWEQLIMRRKENGVWDPAGYTGLILPHGTLDPFMLPIKHFGVNERELSVQHSLARAASRGHSVGDLFQSHNDPDASEYSRLAERWDNEDERRRRPIFANPLLKTDSSGRGS